MAQLPAPLVPVPLGIHCEERDSVGLMWKEVHLRPVSGGPRHGVSQPALHSVGPVETNFLRKKSMVELGPRAALHASCCPWKVWRDVPVTLSRRKVLITKFQRHILALPCAISSVPMGLSVH